MDKQTKNKTKNSKSFLKTFFLIILFIIILCIVALLGITFALIKTSPPLKINEILNLSETSILYDDKGNVMDEVITTDENGNIIKRTVITLEDTPPYLKEAFISIEDERFYKHKGIDIKRIFGVLCLDIKNKITRQDYNIQGASTITQQLIKNRLFLIDSQTNRISLKRKIQELYLALQLEKCLTKDQIIEAYLNTIFLGANTHGVEAASKHYFSKSAKDLNLLECAFLAGINQSPSQYYPFSGPAKKDPSKYINRTKIVLNKMYELGYIKTKEDYDNAINDLENNKLVFKPSNKNNDVYTYEWFSRSVIEQIKKDLKVQYNYSDAEIVNIFMNGGLNIYTTMDKELQNKTQYILNNDSTLSSVSKIGKNNLIEPQASAVIMDYHNGEVKAIVGGRGNQPASSINRATSPNFRRAVGSTIKPITVYGAAIDSKIATAATVIEDSPVNDEFANRYSSDGKPYYPNNDDFKFMGNITLRQALKHSRNVVATKLEDQIGLKTAVSYAEKFNIPIDSNTDENSMAALSLGQIHGTNTLTMAAAYGVFGNYGIYSEPRLYSKVTDKNGKVILENKYVSHKILSPESSYIMYDLLKGPVSPDGTGPNAKFSSMPVAGKTGTATDKKDLWFCGLTPYYSAAVWIGNDDWSKFYGLSSNSAAALWGKIMQEAHKDLKVKDIEPPGNINTVKICMDSGKLAKEGFCDNDSKGNRIITEMFIAGTEPTALCDKHIDANINKPESSPLDDAKNILDKYIPNPDKSDEDDKNNENKSDKSDKNKESESNKSNKNNKNKLDKLDKLNERKKLIPDKNNN